MPIKVRAFAQYLTSPAQMRSGDFAALNFIKLLKGEAFIGNYSDVPLRGRWHRITKESRPLCEDNFADWAAHCYVELAKVASVALVPIPNKAAVVGGPDEFATLGLCRAMQQKITPTVPIYPCLRWGTPLEKAHNGGPRWAHQIYPHLTFVPPPGGKPQKAVLIDDVCTTGSHIQVSATRCRENGIEVVAAICAGKTHDTQQANPFALPDIELPDYDPNAVPWGF